MDARHPNLQLQKVPPPILIILRHNLNEVLHSPTIEIVTMISLDGVLEGCWSAQYPSQF